MVKTQNRYKKLESLRFGRLTVLEREWEKTTRKNKWKVYWKCQCDCGNVTIVRAEHLKENGKSHTRSCGCIQKEKARINGRQKKLPIGEHSARKVFYDYRMRAKKKELTFFLTRATFNQIIRQDCFYCGCRPANKHVNGKDSTDFLIYNGIDRKDSALGYETDNIVPCCAKCNYAKSDTHIDEFLKWIKKVHEKSCNNPKSGSGSTA